MEIVKKIEMPLPGKYIALSEESKKYEFRFQEDGTVKKGREKLEIGLIEEDGLIYTVYNKNKYLVEVLEKSQNHYHVLINGVSYKFSVETPISYKRKKLINKKQQKSSMESVLSPMPGKIINIMQEEGAEIKEGDPLLILEAMKMQNEIVSHVSGKITTINVKAEDTVNKDEVLVEINKM